MGLNKIGVKTPGGDSGRVAQDFEGKDDELEDFLCESDGETVDPDAKDSDLEEISEEYQPVCVAKRLAAAGESQKRVRIGRNRPEFDFTYARALPPFWPRLVGYSMNSIPSSRV